MFQGIEKKVLIEAFIYLIFNGFLLIDRDNIFEYFFKGLDTSETCTLQYEVEMNLYSINDVLSLLFGTYYFIYLNGTEH
jgi:hypothetical protein